MKFFSTLTIFIASFIGSILAADCNNPLLTAFNISKLDAPANVTDIKYCKSLQSGQSCCSAETINGFQAKADALAEKLKAVVASRDRQIVEARDQVIPGLRNSLQQLQTNSQQALNVLKGKKQQGGNSTNGTQGVNQTEGQQQGGQPQGGEQPQGGQQQGGQQQGGQQQGGQQQGGQQQGGQQQGGQLPPQNNGTNNTNPPPPINSSSPGFSAASSLAESLGKLSQEVVDGLPQIKGNFSNFQKSRSTCVVEMVKLQAAAWCLSCDPNYGSKGVSGENVLLSNNVCGRLQGACFEFISQSSQQSSILSIKKLAPKIGKMSEGLQMIIADNSTGLTELTGAVDGASGSNEDAPPVGVPENCTSGQCAWICTDLFRNGHLNETLISAGGEPSSIADNSETGTSRILLEEGTVVRSKLMNRRVLQTSEWNPDQDEAGVQVTFVDDPAGVNSNAGGLVQICSMLMVALMAIFMI